MRKYYNDYQAIAIVKGGRNARYVYGQVTFTQTPSGVLIIADIHGLPQTGNGFFGFHIHEGSSCTGEGFVDSGSHFNPGGAAHPKHAGDLPPLMLCGTFAYSQVLTDRFKLADVIGRTVIIHDRPDDFTTQPAGNAGTKIACGVIEAR